jgi:Tol biopolymer transport system component
MRSMDRFDSRLPQLLDELSQPRTPDWFDDFVGLAARTRQRPAWTLPERWLPMLDVARQPVIAPRMPWRQAAIALLVLALAIAALVALVVGTQRRIPPPYGLAQNGLIAFDRAGDIFVADATSGHDHVIVASPDFDTGPIWSLDGTRIAFERRTAPDTRLANVYVANALLSISDYAFSPDGRRLLMSTGSEKTSIVYVAQTDGSGITRLGAGTIAAEPAWRPPDGHEILYVGHVGFDSSLSDGAGIYVIDPVSGATRTIRERADGRYPGGPKWSPDGTRIAYSEWTASDNASRTHIVAADGSGDKVIPLPTGATWDWFNAWSNDGNRLIVVRGYGGDSGPTRAAVVPSDASGLGDEFTVEANGTAGCCDAMAWAPDDSFIVGIPTDGTGAAQPPLLLDPATGSAKTPPWLIQSYPSIQRIAR